MPDSAPEPAEPETREACGWEHFPHQADIGVRGFGPSPAAAFVEAAKALTAVVTDLDQVRPRQPVKIRCGAPDLEILLVEWLNSVICAMATERMLFSRFEVHLEPDRLDAVAWGERADPARHRPAVEVKGATMTSLAVHRSAGGRWTAQCVVDV